MKHTQRRFSSGAALLILLWILVPLVGLGAVSYQLVTATPETGDAVYAPVEMDSDGTVNRGSLRLDWSVASTVVAPSWAGTVNDVLVSPGDKIRTGTPLVSINGIQRIAFISDQAFYRPLDYSTSGPDVALLNVLLETLGLPSQQGERFAQKTWEGVRQLNHEVDPSSTTLGEFDPSVIIVIPHGGTGSGVVQNLAVAPGAPAPAPGTEVLTLRPQLRSATVVPIQPSGAAESETAAAPAEPVPEGSTLELAGTELALGKDRSRVAASSLPAAASVVAADALTVDVTVRRPLAEGEFIVPVAAIVTDSNSEQCVLVRNGSTDTPVAISPLTSSAGRAVVRGELAVDQEVRIAVPGDERSCG